MVKPKPKRGRSKPKLGKIFVTFDDGDSGDYDYPEVCGVVWCGVVWCGAVPCRAVRCGMVVLEAVCMTGPTRPC